MFIRIKFTLGFFFMLTSTLRSTFKSTCIQYNKFFCHGICQQRIIFFYNGSILMTICIRSYIASFFFLPLLSVNFIIGILLYYNSEQRCSMFLDLARNLCLISHKPTSYNILRAIVTIHDSLACVNILNV